VEISNQITGSAVAASVMTSGLIVVAQLSTVPLLATAARTIWTLAKDGAFPFAKFVAHVDEKRGIPTNAIYTSAIFLALLGLLNIGSTTAFNAFLSLAIIGLYISYLSPVVVILWRRIRHPEILLHGPFKLGKLGIPINVLAILYTIFASIFLLCPPYRPVTPLNFNYAPALMGGVLILSGSVWIFKGRREYTGPLIDATAQTASVRPA
jgi:choline transport protein